MARLESGYYERRSVKPRLENLYQAHRGVEYFYWSRGGNVLDAEILCVAYHGTAEDLGKRYYTAGKCCDRTWNIMSQGLQCELKGHR